MPDYVSVQEVKRVCRELKIRDWTMLEKAEVLPKEAEAILAELETGGIKIRLKDFRLGLEVELEHGIRFPEANVTNNHPILTGKIVLAHFKESLDYGFKYEDYLKFVNSLLEYAISTKNNGDGKEPETISSFRNSSIIPSLPMQTENLIIREFDKENDSKLIEEWSRDKFGRYFVLSMTSSLDSNIEKLISSLKNSKNKQAF